MLKALRNRDFRLLWVGSLVSSLGTWLLVLALPAHVFLVTGSLRDTGLILAAQYLPALVLGPVAGVLTDRWDRRRLMIATSVFRAGSVAVMLLGTAPGRYWVLYAALVAESAGGVLYGPAALARTPAIVGTGPLLNSANALNAVADGAVRLIGGPLGGVLLTLLGIRWLICADALSYLVSAAAIAMTSRPARDQVSRRAAVVRTSRRARDQESRRAAVRDVARELAAGVRVLRAQPVARALLPVTVIFLAANASLSAVLIPFGVQRLGGSEHTGFLLSALGVGFLLGAPVLRALLDRGQPRILLTVTLAATAVAYFALFTSSSLSTALPAAAAIGMFGSMSEVIPQTAMQRVIPDAVLGRVSAVFLTGEAAATLVGAVAGPFLAQAVHLPGIAAVASAATLLAALLAFLAVPPPKMSEAAVRVKLENIVEDCPRGEVRQSMCTMADPAGASEVLAKLRSLAGYLADLDAAQLPAEELGRYIRELVKADAVLTAALAPMLAAYDAKDGHQADGQKTLRTWLVHMARVTRAQAAQYKAIQALARHHEPLLAGLRTSAVTTSEALQLAKWTVAIPAEFRGQAEEILIAAAGAGADLRALAQICAEIRSRTVPPDPDGRDPALDRALFLDTTLDGAGVLRGDLTPECAAMVQAVLDALSAPAGAGDLRTRPQRYHDALAAAMKRLLASGLLPQRAGQPVKALVHMSFADLCDLDADSKLQEAWIAGYRARWAAQRAAASVSTGDGGAWLEGDAARQMACDAMLVPVVTADLDPGAVEVLIGLCVQYDRLRGHAAAGPGRGPRPGRRAGDSTVTPAGSDDNPRAGRRPAGRRRCWPCWSTRSWPPSCRSSPAPAASPPSSAATCSARA